MTMMLIRSSNLLHVIIVVAATTLMTDFSPALVEAFVTTTSSSSCQLLYQTSFLQAGVSPPTEGETEVERLLRKARELREQASKQEQEIHQQLSTKKTQKEAHYDNLIDYYLCDTCTTQDVVDRMHNKQVSIETLEHLIDRLDDRHAIASGKEHVDHNFQRTIKQKDEVEMQKLDDMIELLLNAVQVLDDEFQKAHANRKTGGVAGNSKGSLLYSVSAAEATHWGGGKATQNLKQRLQEKRRERHEQFLKRQEEFYEAQRIKKERPPPPKVGDDHGFL